MNFADCCYERLRQVKMTYSVSMMRSVCWKSYPINARSFYDLETLVWEAKSNANNELSKFKAAISQAEERLEACDELLSIVKSYRDSQPNAGKIQS